MNIKSTFKYFWLKYKLLKIFKSLKHDILIPSEHAIFFGRPWVRKLTNNIFYGLHYSILYNMYTMCTTICILYILRGNGTFCTIFLYREWTNVTERFKVHCVEKPFWISRIKDVIERYEYLSSIFVINLLSVRVILR